MIFWKGFGIVVPVIAVGTMVASWYLINRVGGDDYYSTHASARLTAYCVTGLALWFSGRWLNRPRGKVFIEKDTGREFRRRSKHSFLFLRVQYWAFVVIGIGLYMTFG